jgi:hypothetical protein
MNFGKHGRTVMLAALFGSTSALVFGGLLPGVASAESGSITLNGAKGGGDRLLGACVTITSTDSNAKGDLPVVFTGKGSTNFSYSTSMAPNSQTTIELSDELANVQYDANKGVNLKVSVGSKNKDFWIADPTASCANLGGNPVQAPKGKKAKHAPKAATTAATTSTCQENSFLDTMSPAAGSAVRAGSTVSVVYNDESPLYTPSLNVSFSLFGDVTKDVVLSPGPVGKEKYSTRISYALPADLADGTYMVKIYAQDSDQNKAGGDCGNAEWAFTVSGGQSTGTPPPSTGPTGTTGGGGTSGGGGGNSTCLLKNKLTPMNGSTVSVMDVVGWIYSGVDLDANNVVFTMDGNAVTPTIGPDGNGNTAIYYATNGAMAPGSYSMTITAPNNGGQCASASTTFQFSNPYYAGPT